MARFSVCLPRTVPSASPANLLEIQVRGCYFRWRWRMRSTDRWHSSWLSKLNAVSLNSYLTPIVTRRPTTWSYSPDTAMENSASRKAWLVCSLKNIGTCEHIGGHGHGYACRHDFSLTPCCWSWRLSCGWTTTNLSPKMEILPMKESEGPYFRGSSTHILPEAAGPNPCLSLTRKNWHVGPKHSSSATGVY